MPSDLAYQLAGVWAKLDFADECVNTLDDEWHGPEHIKAIRIAFEYDTQTEWHTAYLSGIHQVPRLCALAGASLHQARSALNHMVWILVKRNRKKPGNHNSFPIWPMGNTEAFMRETRRSAVKNSCRGKRPPGALYGTRRSATALIEQLQPYRSPNGPEGSGLFALNRLANIDRHQDLADSLTWVNPAAIRPLFVAGEGSAIIGYRNLLRDPQLNRLVDGTKLARIRMEPAPREPEVEVEDELPINVAFGDGATFQSIQALRDIIRQTRTIIEVLDTFGGMTFGPAISGGGGLPPWQSAN